MKLRIADNSQCPLCNRLLSLPCKCLQDGLQCFLALARAGFPALEFDPALVKAIEHPDAGCGVLHALRFEEGLPGVARDCFYRDGMTQQIRERGSYLIGCDTSRAFEFNDSVANPFFLKKLGGDLSDVHSGDHGDALVEGLEKAGNDARAAG